MGVVDLHLHSTASDGEVPPAEVARRAAEAGLVAFALTDHDTVAGVPEAVRAGAPLGLRVVAGCEFSVEAFGQELHLLGYFLPVERVELLAFLRAQRSHRVERARAMVDKLTELGAPIPMEAIQRLAGNASVGRPHVARVLLEFGHVTSFNDAFQRFLADGAPAYVPKRLPALARVVHLVRGLGGVTAAAHLRAKGTRGTLERLRDAGVDAVEVLHPAHDADAVARLQALSRDVGLLESGGSDWHGDAHAVDPHRLMGAQRVPAEWLDALERLHIERTSTTSAQSVR